MYLLMILLINLTRSELLWDLEYTVTFWGLEIRVVIIGVITIIVYEIYTVTYKFSLFSWFDYSKIELKISYICLITPFYAYHVEFVLES